MHWLKRVLVLVALWTAAAAARAARPFPGGVP